MLWRKVPIVGFIAALFVLAACSTPQAGAGPSLSGTSWVAEQVAGDQMRNNQPPTLAFTQGALSGETACACYSARFDTFGAAGLNVRSLVYPRASCAGGAMQARSDNFLNALDAASSYAITEEGNLVLRTHDHRSLTFRPAA